MTNFATILNDLKNGFDNKNAYIGQLCRYPLLIIDDFGMERDTSYGLEQLYNVIDSRYRSQKPLIVTTNLTLQELQNPEDNAHARIYDRVLEMCVPVHFSGVIAKRRIGTAKFFTLLLLLYRTSANIHGLLQRCPTVESHHFHIQ